MKKTILAAKKTLKLVPLLLSLATAAAPARATTFVKDLMVIGGTKSEVNDLKTTLTGQGWTVIDYDLNKGCGSSTDYIYLLYKAGNTPGGNSCYDYVTDIYIQTGSTPPNSISSGGKTYYPVPYDGGSHFKTQKGDLNSNAGGAAIHLYYTKDAFSPERAVSSIWFNDTQSGAVGEEGGSTGYDLNDGCGGNTAYIYMHFSTSGTSTTIDLSALAKNYEAANGITLTGTLTANYTVSIANGATVTLNNVTIGSRSGMTAPGIACSGNATLTLSGANSVSGSSSVGISIPSGKTLTINGSGSLAATGTGNNAAIGSAGSAACGNITLSGGTVTATKGGTAANSIGPSQSGASCGTITIGGVSTGAIRQNPITYSSTDTTSFTASFNANGGTGSTSAITSRPNTPHQIPANGFTRAGYTFAEWNAAANGSGATYDVGQWVILKNTTIYAQWSRLTYSIGYDLKSGSLPSGKTNPTSYSVDTATFTLNNPTRNYYNFAGWTGTGLSSAQTTVTISKGSTGNRTYTATWTPVTYNISYNLDSGTLPSSHPTTYNIESANFTLVNPTRTGYNFAGWTGTGLSSMQTSVTIARGSTGDRTYTAHWVATASPKGSFDACTGSVGQITISGWTYDPDATTESIGVQVKIYQSDGTTLYKTENLTADHPRNDVNNTYHITGQHGYSATIAIADGGTYQIKVYAIDTNSDGNPQIGSTQTVTVTPGVTLTSETGNVTLQSGDVLAGTGGANTRVTIADGATVTLSGVDITGIANDGNHPWAGITCAGDAIIILADGTTNNVKGGYSDYSGIYVPEGSTLTIRGSGTLNASSNGYGAGIGSGRERACGNIVIDGGTVTATGGNLSAGIGGAYKATCGDITITANVTSVTASKGGGAGPGPYSIGAGRDASCGTVTIAGIEVGCIGDDVYTFTPADIVSVSFHANGGTGTMGSQTFIKGVPVSLNASTFAAPNDYSFIGWNTKADGSGISYSNRQSITITDDMTLYAQWRYALIDLSQVGHGSSGRLFEVQASDGDIITGWGAENVMVQIAAGSTVTLRNAHIALQQNKISPGIHTLGDATIILEGYNYVEGGGDIWPGIRIMESNTLTIRGNGSLEAKNKTKFAAGIGEFPGNTSGNIVIEGSVTSIVASGDPAIGNNSNNNTGVTIDGNLITIGNTYNDNITILNRNMPQTDAADNGYLLGLYNGQRGINVTLNGRTLYKDGAWNTLCLPFNLSAQQVASQLAPAKLMTLGSTSFSGGTLTLQFAAAIDIKAGKPYIIRWDGGDDLVDPTFEGVTVNASAAPVETQYADFIGTFSPVTFEAGDGAALLLGSDGTPAHPAADTTLDAFRAYIRLKNVEPAAVDGYALDFEPAHAYTIRFDANGRSGTMPDQTFILGEPQSLVVCTFTAPDGDLFCGWNTASDGTGTAFADRESISAIADMTLYAQWAGHGSTTVTLNSHSGEVTLYNGDMLTGTDGKNTHVTIADGATVVLIDVNITDSSAGTNKWAGITCDGDATIILVGDNAVKGRYNFPGIFVPEGKTLTIQGGGSLSATGGSKAAGIGGSYNQSCGNIAISGDVGRVAATAGNGAPYSIGHGDGRNLSCGMVTIGGVETGPLAQSPYVIDSSGPCTVLFDANGGTGEMTDQTFSCGVPQSLTACTFTAPEGNLFWGWNTASDGTGTAFADRESISAIADMTLYAQWTFRVATTVTLSNGTGEVTLRNCDMLTGTGGKNTHVTIADGATVVLSGVNITKTGDNNWAGITCKGDATIILEGDNAVKGRQNFPGISVSEGKTLTIQGDGSLSATGGNNAAGIGGGKNLGCGNIVIKGGAITATGKSAAGIGTGNGSASCGNITIGAGITSLVASGTPCIGEKNNPTITIAPVLVSEGRLSGGTFTLTPATGYERWTRENGFSGAWDAIDASGVVNVFRYAFDVPEGPVTNPPLLSISFGADGKPVITTPPLVNTAGYSLGVFASDNLDGTGNAVTYPLDASGETAIDESGKTSRFFRLKATEQ